MLLAIPPIAWIVLAVLWFGPTTPAVLFTVVVSLATVPYLAAVNGVATVDAKLSEMTRAFRLGTWQRIRVLYGPHLLMHLSPAAVSAFGLAWRLTLLAEVVGATSGIGSGLAAARSTLDTAESFAWIGIVVLLFLTVRFGVLGPLERRLSPRPHGGRRSIAGHD
ncbi:MAG: ABC transporter permease subunit, partial [Pseudomonadota bacterium]